MTRALALWLALTPVAAMAHLEPAADCCNAPGLYCDDGDCDSSAHHHHHDAAKCGTCTHSGVATAPTLRAPNGASRPVAAEIRSAEPVRAAPSLILPGSRAPPDATC